MQLINLINIASRSNLTILLVLLFLTSSSGQDYSGTLASNDNTRIGSSDEIPKTLTRKFKRDPARLALRLEAKKEDLRYQNIVIPPENIENIYKMLTSIYLQDETAKSIERCKIHTFKNPSIDHIVVIFERDVDWAAPLLDGISETDSDEINDLLDEYDLIIEKHVMWNDDEDAITIRSKEPLNMAAISNEFYNIEGVVNIDLGIPKTSGNDINLLRVDGGWEIQYVLRFGSMLNDGEGKLHIWKYHVLDNGEVKFISEGGDPVPEWMRCYFEKGTDNIMARG